MSAKHLILAALVCFACGCGRDERAESSKWRAGDSLFDRPGDLTWSLDQGAALPAHVLDSGGTVRRVSRLSLDADDWLERIELDRVTTDTWNIAPDSVMWVAPTVTAVRFGEGHARIVHEARNLPRDPREGATNVWRDDEAGLLFWWRTDGKLAAIGKQPPGNVQVIGDDTRNDEDPEAPSTLADVGPRVDSLTLGNDTRRAVALPVGSELRFPERLVAGHSLHLSVAVLPRAYTLDGDLNARSRLLTAAQVGVGVDAWIDGERQPLLDVTLSAKGATWRSLRVDVSTLVGQHVGFSLRSHIDGRPIDGTAFVAWSDGVFTGGSEHDNRAGRPHVIVISIDTLRADRLGLYGHGRDTTPQLDAWAQANATVFDDSVSDSNYTLPSTATLLTGLATRQHGLLGHPAALRAATPTLAGHLAAAGYDTLGIVEGGFVKPAFGFHRGFGRMVVAERDSFDWSAALDLLDQRGDDRPVFAFLHTYRVHAPWLIDERFADPEGGDSSELFDLDLTVDLVGEFENKKRVASPADQAEIRRRYDTDVARMDRALGAFLADLDARVDVKDRLVIITSDHGEHLFDHGHVTHGRALYDSVLRVPLLVSWPGAARTGRSDAPAAGVDVVPTVLDVLGLPIDESLAGRSLRDAGAQPTLRVSQHGERTYAARLGGWKLIVSGDEGEHTELYDLASDPGETDDLAQRQPDRVASLKRLLDGWLARHLPIGRSESGGTALDPDVAADLRALGYLGDDG